MSKMYEALKKAQEEGVPVEIPAPMAADSAELLAEPVEAPPVDDPEPAPEIEEPIVFMRERSSPPAHVYEPPASEIPPMPATENREGIRHVPIQTTGRIAVIPWDANSPGGEQYRIIRTRLVQHPSRPKVIAMSSSGSGDGKTVSAINIAGVLSLRDNANVLLIDADFRRAGASNALGLPSGPGLANVLSRTCNLQDALIRVQQFPNMYVLTAGTGDANPAELLDSEQWRALCASVREHFDFVIIDAPPIAAVADYELIQAVCDGVIFVVRPDHSDRTLVNKAYQLIPAEQRLGVVLNCASKWFLWKTHESYYYSGHQQQ